MTSITLQSLDYEVNMPQHSLHPLSKDVIFSGGFLVHADLASPVVAGGNTIIIMMIHFPEVCLQLHVYQSLSNIQKNTKKTCCL